MDPSSTGNVMRLSAGTCATQRRPCVQTLLQRGRAERHTAAQGTEQLQVQRPGLSSAGSPSVPWLGPATGGTPASQHPTQGTPLKTKHSTHPKKKALVLFGQSRGVPAGRTDLTNPGTRRYRQQEMRAQCLQRSVIRGALVDALAGTKALLKHRRKMFKVDSERQSCPIQGQENTR